MLKYNDTSIFTGYIKQLLHSFNLPTIKVYKEGMFILEGNYYIYENKISKALLSTRNVNSSSFQTLSNYKYAKPIEHFSKNLIINNNIYDSYTHNYLGEYLRFQKHYNKLDLMSLYNCFSNETPKLLNISSSNPLFSFDTQEYGYKIYMLPVSLFEEYTIAISSDKPIEIVCGFYNKTQYIHESFNAFYNATYQKINSCNFNNPFIYNKINNLTDYILLNNKVVEHEQQLKMFIKIPTSNNSSIVVVEGNYASNNDFVLNNLGKLTIANHSINNYKQEASIDNYDMNNIKLISKLQLFKINSFTHHPFADRLFEYLVYNAITNIEEIDDNIKKLQLALIERYNLKTSDNRHPFKGLTSFKNYGIWEDKYKNILYDIATQENIINSKTDILGYCDKDLEQKLFNKELENNIYKEDIK